MKDHELRLLRDVRDNLGSIREDLHAIRKEQEAQRQHDNIPTPPPVLRSELEIPERAERANQANSNREYRIQKWLTVGTWLAFIAAAIYAGVAESTRRAMVETLVEVRKQTTAAQQSATAATDAATTAQKTLRITTQADVSIESFMLTNAPIEVGKTVLLEVTLRNSGKLAAKGFTLDAISELRNSNPSTVKKEGQRHSGPMDIPEGTRRVLLDAGRFTSLGSDLGLPPKQSLYVYGRFSYNDGYASRTETFCALYLPASVPRMGVCESPQ
jgi:hypothetical protein